MSELSYPPFRSPIGLVRSQNGTVVGQVTISEAPWTQWLEGIYARAGSLNAPSNKDLSTSIITVQADLNALEALVGSTTPTNSELAIAIATLTADLAILQAQVDALPAAGEGPPGLPGPPGMPAMEGEDPEPMFVPVGTGMSNLDMAVKKTLDQTMTTLGDVTSLSFPVVAGHYYSMRFVVIAHANAANGVGLAVTYPAATVVAVTGVT